MKTYCLRLHRGDDLLEEIRALARREQLAAGVILSAVGCVSRARVRDAGGVRLRALTEPCEILSLQGTVSAARTHLHIALSREDLSVLGGHLVSGCIINTTCELVIGVPAGWRFGSAADPDTGYDELVLEQEVL